MTEPSAEHAKQDGEASKLWGGRFTGKTDPLMEEFNASIGVDKRMYRADITGSRAYASAICKAGLLTESERDQLHDGLNQVLAEWDSGTFEIKPGDEDIHTANERRLKELIGSVAGKLHTGRSRNDQVATDMRLWLRDHITALCATVKQFIEVASNRAEQETGALMPGYTHLQRAQPILWSHWVLSHAWALVRDVQRLESLKERANLSPLGSGALAGNPFDIDREALAKDLGFSGITGNSLDAVADRDFVAEYLFCTSMLMTHLSKWAEDLCVYCSIEFSFVKLADAYSTGSSLMPQKKNPDSLELVRGQSGTVFGKLAGFMMSLKGLPSTYNKDLQEDKSAMFDVADTVDKVLRISIGVLSTLNINEKAMRGALSMDMLATDLAYYLVRKGVPFRDAHHLSGECVALAEKKGTSLSELSAEDFRSVHTSFDDDVLAVFNFDNSVKQYKASGGTSPSSVLEQIKKLRVFLTKE